MTIPLIVLAVLSAIGGFVGVPGKLFGRPRWNLIEHFLEPVLLPIGSTVEHSGIPAGHHAVSLGLEWGLVALSVAVAAAGIWMAARFYLGSTAFERPQRLAQALPLAHRLLFDKYWIDEIYGALVIRPIHRLAVLFWKVFDELIIDTIFVNGAAFTVELTGDLMRFTTTGNVRNYALSVALAVAVLAAWLW
jgi:NADH-quinone oxidoreductase subunit L